MMRQFELVELVKGYDPGADEDAAHGVCVVRGQVYGDEVA